MRHAGLLQADVGRARGRRCAPARCPTMLSGRDEVTGAALARRPSRRPTRRSGPPIGSDDHHRARRGHGRATCRSSSGSSTARCGTPAAPRRRRSPAPRRTEPVASTTPAPPAAAVGQLVGGRHVTRLDDHPEPPALGLEPADQLDQPLATHRPATATAGPPPTGAAASTRSTRVATERRDPGGLEPGRTAAARRTRRDPRRRARRAGRRAPARGRRPRAPTRARPTHDTIGLRASRTWHVWLQRMQGRTCSGSPAASFRPTVGVGDLGPGHLDRVAHAVAERPLGLARRRPSSPGATTGISDAVPPGPRPGSTGTGRG